jgi:hypothetical protein
MDSLENFERHVKMWENHSENEHADIDIEYEIQYLPDGSVTKIWVPYRKNWMFKAINNTGNTVLSLRLWEVFWHKNGAMTPKHVPLQSVESQPTFRRNISLPSSGLKNKASKKPTGVLFATWYHAGFFLGLFDPEDGSDMFLRNVG